MRTSSPQSTIVEYDPADSFHKQGSFYLPSGEEADRLFRKKRKRNLSVQNKPKDMYRWGKVVSSKVLKEGTMVYYSQYDASEFVEDGKTYNTILNEHLLAMV